MGMKLHCLAGVVGLIALGVFVGCATSNPSSPSTGTGLLYLATQGDSLLTPFAIDLGAGTLSSPGKAAATGDTPTAMIMAPDGSALFVVNSGGGSNNGCGSVGGSCITAYTLNSDGSIATAGSPVAAGTNPRGMAMDSGGKLLFVANQGSNDVSVFTVSGTTLTAVPQSPSLIFGSNPVAVAVTPDGKFLYVANQVDGTVTQFSVDASGVLTQPGGFLYPVGTTPTGMTVTADGNFLYVANQGSNNISVFTICFNATPSCVTPDGTLTAGTTVSAGTGPVAVTEDPSSTFLYVVDKGSNQLSQYRISLGTGALTPLSPAAVSVGSTPLSVGVRAGETVSSVTTNYVYVANSGSSSVSVFSYVTTAGTLGVLGSPVAVGGQPSALVVK